MDHQPRRLRHHSERPRARRPNERHILGRAGSPDPPPQGSYGSSGRPNFQAPKATSLAAVFLFALAPLLHAEPQPTAPPEKTSDAAEFIHWLLQENRDLTGIPFSEVLASTSGKKILPIDAEADSAWLARLGAILDATLAELNKPTHAIHTAGRINEASRFIEDELLARCNAEPGWSCGIPRTAAGEEQRSGYPDLRLVLADGSIAYLDPKLHAAENRTSTLRTFYYEPKTTTGKVHDDARHLLIGVSHNGGAGGRLRFTGWELVDVSKIKVRLKAEFQAANSDLYREDTVVLQNHPPTEKK